MKVYRILCLAAAIVVPQLALAKLPFSNEVFGKMEGTLDFCARENPDAAPKYQERKKALVRDVPTKEVAAARKTQEYGDGYDWISNELGKAPKEQVRGACAAILEENK